MDPVRFDDLTRLLSEAGGRRTLLRALLGTVLGGAASDALAKKRDKGESNGDRNAKNRRRNEVRDQEQGRGPDRTHAQPLERLGAEGRKKGKKRKSKKKRGRKDQNGGQPPAPLPETCCGARSCADPEPGSTRSQCRYAGRSFAGQDHNGSTLRGIDGRGAAFNRTNHHGSIFAEACLQGARFRGAFLDDATLGRGVPV